MSEEGIRQSTLDLLLDLIRIPSVRGEEGPAIRRMREAMDPLVDEWRYVWIDASLKQDPDYAFPLPGISYKDRPNLECIMRGSLPGPRLIFNTHLDVVPASEGQEDAFKARVEGDVLYGRGACDAKGQAATLFAMAQMLREAGGRFPGEVLFHFVIEEENGGNGTLAMVRRGVEAQAAVVLEPSELAVVPAVRGAVWFRLRVLGQAGHSGSRDATVSALKKAMLAMEKLEEYHDQLLQASRGHPLFDQFEDPMPLTFGQLQAGKWPASVPSEAILKGVFGFLPNKTRHQVQEGMRKALEAAEDSWLRQHFELTFPMLNADGYALPPDHPLVEGLLQSLRERGAPAEVRAMTAACDAWYYNNQLGIPTVVFGPGFLGDAHGPHEKINIQDIMIAADCLAHFVAQHIGDVSETGQESTGKPS